MKRLFENIENWYDWKTWLVFTIGFLLLYGVATLIRILAPIGAIVTGIATIILLIHTAVCEREKIWKGICDRATRILKKILMVLQFITGIIFFQIPWISSRLLVRGIRFFYIVIFIIFLFRVPIASRLATPATDYNSCPRVSLYMSYGECPLIVWEYAFNLGMTRSNEEAKDLFYDLNYELSERNGTLWPVRSYRMLITNPDWWSSKFGDRTYLEEFSPRQVGWGGI